MSKYQHDDHTHDIKDLITKAQYSGDIDKVNSARYHEIRKVTVAGLIINGLLAVMQLFGGFFTFSQGLIADGLHTLSDLVSDFVVLVAAKLGNKAADEDHPYGHGRFETIATVVLGLSLCGVAAGIFIHALDRLLGTETLKTPANLALLFAVIVMLSKEGLYHFTLRTAKRIKSQMLTANAWHHRSDALSSLIVLLGIAGSVFLNLPWLDLIAAMIVAVMIFYMGIRLVLDSTKELIDTALDADKVAEIGEYIQQLEGVEKMYHLRTRKMGDNVVADVHIQVNGYLSVSEGHYIAEAVEQRVKQQFAEIKDLTVHIDPENEEGDEREENSLPGRKQIMQSLFPHLTALQLDQSIDNIALHYLNNTVEIEIVLNSDVEFEVLEKLKEACVSCEFIGNITVHRSLMRGEKVR